MGSVKINADMGTTKGRHTTYFYYGISCNPSVKAARFATASEVNKNHQHSATYSSPRSSASGVPEYEILLTDRRSSRDIIPPPSLQCSVVRTLAPHFFLSPHLGGVK